MDHFSTVNNHLLANNSLASLNYLHFVSSLLIPKVTCLITTALNSEPNLELPDLCISLAQCVFMTNLGFKIHNQMRLHYSATAFISAFRLLALDSQHYFPILFISVSQCMFDIRLQFVI